MVMMTMMMMMMVMKVMFMMIHIFNHIGQEALMAFKEKLAEQLAMIEAAQAQAGS